MQKIIIQLEQNIKIIEETIASLTMQGQNRLMEFKNATMLTTPTIIQIEEEYRTIVKEIFHYNRSIKFLKKSIKHLDK